jgi:hypothetical protein
MTDTLELEKVIIQGIKDLPHDYLDEVADFVVFIKQKKANEQLKIDSERKQAMLIWLANNRRNAPKLDPSIDIRALIDQTHDREL